MEYVNCQLVSLLSITMQKVINEFTTMVTSKKA